MRAALPLARLAVALGALVLPVGLACAEPLAPEMIDAFTLLGEHDRALLEARALLDERDADWRAHAAYIQAASASHLRWAVLDEYRWLAEQSSADLPVELLAAYAAVVTRGEALDEALASLATAAGRQGRPGALLLARGLMGAAAFEWAASELVKVKGPEAAGLRVEALVGLGEHRQAGKLVREAIELYPSHPELGAALWSRGVQNRSVRRARRQVVQAARALLDSDDPRELYRAWTLLAWAKERDEARLLAERLAQDIPGLELPDRLPYGPAMIEHLGESLARTGRDQPPTQLTARERGAVASVRARTLRQDGLLDPARRAYREAIELTGDDPQLLLEAAALHLDVEPRLSLEWVGQALLVLACQPGLEPAVRRASIARALKLQAQALHALEHHDQALSYQLVASLLQPTPEGLVELAALQEQQGSVESALESLAIAAAMGSERARGEMERLYQGPASVDALVRAVQADLEAWLAAPPKPALQPRPLVLPGRALSTTDGDLFLDDLRGQVVVLVFWASWCAPCAKELPLVDGLAASWADEGLPVRVLAVSVDDRETDYRRGLRRFQDLGIPLAWEPNLAKELDIDAVPATRLFDVEGRAAGRIQGFQSGHEAVLDELVRSLLER